MANVGTYVMYLLAALLALYSLARRDSSLKPGLTRALEQFVKLAPRMVCALVAAGFTANLVPTEIIGRYLGDESGFTGILIGAVAGMIVPSGPVISFAVAAALASQGASLASLISFITGWSLFAVHRILIFEGPLLGFSFVRFRMLSVMALPIVAGALALVAMKILSLANH